MDLTSNKLKYAAALTLFAVLVLFQTNTFPATKYQLCPNLALLIFMNFAVFVLTPILKPAVLSQLLSFAPDLTAVTLFDRIYHIDQLIK